jgi:predicted DCC family thiol-disulfide oxidoreductase YuxK
MTEPSTLKNPVVVFDGVCNLCCSSVQFIIKRDLKKRFRFATLQSDFGHTILKRTSLPSGNLNSIILWEEGTCYVKSTAALRIAKHLTGLWPVLSLFIIVPSVLRDSIYSIVANNRYKWFGKKTECWIPTTELNALFIE